MVGTQLYYDPYDREIDRDPYPVYRRLRDEAPLYHNERLDFWALSRFADVEAALKDWKRLSSAKGDILEVVKADPVMPPGSSSTRTHRSTRCTAPSSRGPSRRSASTRSRRRCVPSASRVSNRSSVRIGSTSSSTSVPSCPCAPSACCWGSRMRNSRRCVTSRDGTLRNRPGEPLPVKKDRYFDSSIYADYVDWRAKNPSDDLITELLHVEFEDATGEERQLTQGRAAHVPRRHRRGRGRHHGSSLRLDGRGPR